MEEIKIKIKVGDTVIRKDGLKGKVIQVYNNEIMPEVQYEDGYIGLLDLSSPSKYYLIGHTVLGNKATEEELEQSIADKEKEIQQAKKEKDQLRKQLWRLREEMVEDWRERKALRELRKLNKENQPTEEDTED